jgi:hypothetical protein
LSTAARELVQFGDNTDLRQSLGRKFYHPRDGKFNALANSVVARTKVLLASREEWRLADNAQRYLP